MNACLREEAGTPKARPPTMVVLEAAEGVESLVLPVAAHIERGPHTYLLCAARVGRDVFYQAFEWVQNTKYFIQQIPQDQYSPIYQELCELLPEE
jgi:hypothetical protein